MKNIYGKPISRVNKGKAKINKEITEDQIAGLATNFLEFLEQTIQNQNSKEAELHENLDATLEEFGFTGEARAKCKALFYEAVNNNTSKLQDGIAKLVGQYSIEGDVVDIVGARIAALEDAIAYYEAENLKLATGMVEKFSEQYSLDESVVETLWNSSSDLSELEAKLQQAAQPERAPRRSTVEERLEELNEDGAFAGEKPYIDPQMRKYLNYL